MKKLVIILILLMSFCGISAQKTTLLTDKPSVEFSEGNKKPRVVFL